MAKPEDFPTKTVAVMQPYLFPYLGYFQLISAVDTFVLYENLNYIKDGWVHRNRLLANNGEPFLFVVPVQKKSSFRKIRDVQIASNDWRRKLLQSLQVHYGRAAFFDEVFPVVKQIVRIETDSLARLNYESVVRCCEFLGIETQILSDAAYDTASTGVRAEFGELEEKLALPNVPLEETFPHIRLKQFVPKVVRVVEICRILGAARFVNPIGGRMLYPSDEFQRNRLEIRFLQMRAVPYPQVAAAYRSGGRFQPSLSIIDVFMNCGREHTRQLLREYDPVRWMPDTEAVFDATSIGHAA